MMCSMKLTTQIVARIGSHTSTPATRYLRSVHFFPLEFTAFPSELAAPYRSTSPPPLGFSLGFRLGLARRPARSSRRRLALPFGRRHASCRLAGRRTPALRLCGLRRRALRLDSRRLRVRLAVGFSV